MISETVITSLSEKLGAGPLLRERWPRRASNA
jgi:hypothetical protein